VEGAASSAVRVTLEPAELEDLIEAAGVGVARYCDVAGDSPTLLNDVFRQATALVAPTTTPAPPATTAISPTTEATTATTKASTRPVPVYEPPATQAPAPPAGPPSGTYSDPSPAPRPAGAAPVHVGEPGYGRHLDRDDDGIGCE
jgi:hypothetical protein